MQHVSSDSGDTTGYLTDIEYLQIQEEKVATEVYYIVCTHLSC